MAQDAGTRQEQRRRATVWEGVRLGLLLVGLNGAVLFLADTVIPSVWLGPQLTLFGSTGPLVLYLQYPLLFFLGFFLVGFVKGKTTGKTSAAMRTILTAWIVSCFALFPFTLLLSFVLPNEAGTNIGILGNGVGGVIMMTSQLLAGLGGEYLGRLVGSRFLRTRTSPQPGSIEKTPEGSSPQPSEQRTADAPLSDVPTPVPQDEPGTVPPPEPAEQPKLRISRRTMLRGGIGLAMAGSGVYGLSLLRRDVPLLTYRGHANTVYAVAWSPDGTRIASADYTGSLHLWHPLTGTLAASHDAGALISFCALAWAPDGKRLALGTWDGLARVLDGATLDELVTYESHDNRVNAVGWSPDGVSLAAGSTRFGGSSVRIWEASTGQPVLSYGDFAGSNTLAWSPDGTRIASDANDQEVQVWDARTGQTLLTYQGHTDSVYSVVWSPDGSRIASGSRDTTIQVWEATTGKHQFTCQGDNGFVQGVAWSPDGRYLVSGGWGDETLIWDATSGQLVETLDADGLLTWFVRLWGGGGVFSVSVSPDGQYVVAGGSSGVAVWQL